MGRGEGRGVKEKGRDREGKVRDRGEREESMRGGRGIREWKKSKERDVMQEDGEGKECERENK